MRKHIAVIIALSTIGCGQIPGVAKPFTVQECSKLLSTLVFNGSSHTGVSRTNYRCDISQQDGTSLGQSTFAFYNDSSGDIEALGDNVKWYYDTDNCSFNIFSPVHLGHVEAQIANLTLSHLTVENGQIKAFQLTCPSCGINQGLMQANNCSLQ